MYVLLSVATGHLSTSSPLSQRDVMWLSQRVTIVWPHPLQQDCFGDFGCASRARSRGIEKISPQKIRSVSLEESNKKAEGLIVTIGNRELR